MNPLILTYPGNEPIALPTAQALSGEAAAFNYRKFPDGETYIQFLTPLQGRSLLVFCSLDHPDEKTLPLLFLAETARDLGARRIGLVAPYLGYLRQDRRFQKGEAVTSRSFSKLLSGYFDWLVTVDPHLHRIHDLSQIYSIPSRVVHGAPEISRWILDHVPNPLIVGPDEESLQWVEGIARPAKAPFLVCRKQRLGDREVKVSVPLEKILPDHTPVLVDDIISTGRSMVETLIQIKKLEAAQPLCIGVHGIFAGNAYRELQDAGAGRIVTCNTISHASNGIDLSRPLTEAVRSFL